MPDENPYLKKLRESVNSGGPPTNNDAELFSMMKSEIMRLQADLSAANATILRITAEKSAAVEAAATERGQAVAEGARAMAAERLLSAETKRADDEAAECAKYEAECERLRQALFAEVEARAKAEAAAVAKGKVIAPPAPPPAAPQKPIRYDMIRNEVGDIVSIITKPED